jgi:hypothetical protein
MSYLQSPDPTAKSDTLAARREFLARCGRFAVVTPPAVTLLLSTSLNSSAIAYSSGRRSSDHTFDPEGHDRQFVNTSHDNNSNSSGDSHSSNGGGGGGGGGGDQGGSHGHGHMYSDAGSGGHGGHDNSGLGEDDEGKHHHDH